MIRSWLAYLSLLLLDALLWVSVDGYIYYLLLRVLLMLPILSLLLFLVGNRLIQIHVEPYAEGKASYQFSASSVVLQPYPCERSLAQWIL